jgi:hypothetical protein
MGSQSSEISIQPTTYYKYQTFLLLLHLSFPDRLNPKKISSSLQWRSVNDARSFSLSLSLSDSFGAESIALLVLKSHVWWYWFRVWEGSYVMWETLAYKSVP